MAGKCYKFVSENVTGELAPFVCRRLEAQMVSISTEEEQLYITEYAFFEHQSNEAVWLSARRTGPGADDFLWKTAKGDRPLTYKYWSDHEPDNRDGGEKCVALNDRPEFYGRWLDAPCTTKFHLICEKSARPPPTDDDNEASNDVEDYSGELSDTDGVDTRRADPGEAGARKAGHSESSGATEGTNSLLIALLVTMSLFVATLLMVVYSQRRRLATIIGESRLMTRYRQHGNWPSVSVIDVTHAGDSGRSGSGGSGGQLGYVNVNEPVYSDPVDTHLKSIGGQQRRSDVTSLI